MCPLKQRACSQGAYSLVGETSRSAIKLTESRICAPIELNQEGAICCHWKWRWVTLSRYSSGETSLNELFKVFLFWNYHPSSSITIFGRKVSFWPQWPPQGDVPSPRKKSIFGIVSQHIDICLPASFFSVKIFCFSRLLPHSVSTAWIFNF